MGVIVMVTDCGTRGLIAVGGATWAMGAMTTGGTATSGWVGWEEDWVSSLGGRGSGVIAVVTVEFRFFKRLSRSCLSSWKNFSLSTRRGWEAALPEVEGITYTACTGY